MGLTNRSVGFSLTAHDTAKGKQSGNAFTIALAGNPNVGKSTVFNALTGMNQHTGNWPGKTVASAQGHCKSPANEYLLIDLPGTYSLLSHSAEEEIARNFICFGEPDAVIVVCDATSLERNLNLVLQTVECAGRVLVCINLMDEAKRKQIEIDLPRLRECLGVRVTEAVARKKETLDALLQQLDELLSEETPPRKAIVSYPAPVEEALTHLCNVITQEELPLKSLCARWVALKLLEQNKAILEEINTYLGFDLESIPAIRDGVAQAKELLARSNLAQSQMTDLIGSSYVQRAQEISRKVIHQKGSSYHAFDRRMDRALTGKWSAFPIMLALLALIFWITISLANYPSELLASFFDLLLGALDKGLSFIHTPPWLQSLLLDGILLVLARVVSVMLPPMAIFFPLFTLLEDAGYLPRIAYNLDRPFAACRACGKQALTTCMGFGCNAAGVIGCRIIDSPRERLLAILTNSFVPCNGRFPALIAILTMFFVGTALGFWSSLYATFLLTLLILLSIGATLLCTRLLSDTVLRGMPSSFCLELPPFRPPQIKKVIVRSVFDRTLFVLGRAVTVAIPAGLVLWGMTNISLGGATLFSHCASFLHPFASVLGLDGTILMAFILGFPANEIVIPIMMMAYLQSGSMGDLTSLAETKALFLENGWTPVTAVCVLIFFLFHWPCSTTLLTIHKETKSLKWTLLAALLPTAVGMLLCALIHLLFG